MQLTNGIYLISTIATNPWGERWVQRNTNEDRTLLPKPIAVQPNIDTIPAQWTVQQTSENKYLFSTGNGSGGTIQQDGKVFAELLLQDDIPAQEWTVEQCERCDEGIFTITNDNGQFWQTPSNQDTGADTQILVESLILIQIFPPQYPPSVLFNITEVLS